MPLLCAEKTLSTKLRKLETIKAGSKGAVQGAKPTKEFKSKYTFDIVCLGLFHCYDIAMFYIYNNTCSQLHVLSNIFMFQRENFYLTYIWCECCRHL